MEATKGIKPATPLPWQIGQEHSAGEGTFYNANTIFPAGADVTTGGIAQVYRVPMHQDLSRILELAKERASYAEGYRDAAYIVHACNAYPRMVEALRELADRCDGEEGVRADGSNIQTFAARAVLIQLGEYE